MFAIREWFETEKKKKDAEWANQIIRFIRINWQPLISQDEARVGMAYLLGYQDMSFIENLFQNTTRINLQNHSAGPGLVNPMGQAINPKNKHDENILREMRSVQFKPLPIMEKLRNVLISEMKKMGVVLDVRSEDPTSTSKKIHDKAFIENKKQIESFINYVYTSIGQQPYKLRDHKARFGEKPDNGNTDQFEAMGLNDQDPSDISFFMSNFHKLDEEISAESPINYCMVYNQVILEMEKWVNDIMAKKAVAATCYVSDVTGAIMYRYLAPETVYIYGPGNRKDFNDANAKGYERKVSIKELLDILGNKFDMEAEFDNLLLAITNTMNLEFTDVKPSYRGFVTGTNKLTTRNGAEYDYNQFMSFKVTLGYIEFSSQNQETFDKVTQDGAFFEDNQSTTGKYAEKARWETPTYKAYYLAISQVDQILFDYGELNYQDILGASDFNMNFTIVTYKDVGDPIAIQAAQIIDMVNEAWYKFRYELRRAKPRGRGWNYDSMVSTLMDLIPDTNISSFNKLQKVMEMLDSSSNEIYSFPTIDGKQTMVPGNQLNYDIPNGMSEQSMLWWKIMMDGIQYISDMIGVSPLREGDPGHPRDSMNNQFKALEYSQSATYYVPDMLTYVYQQLAVKTNFYVQDIITYKSYNTVAYKFLEDAIGEETLDKLAGLGKTGMHRFGIFVESLNQGPLRQKLEAVLFEAVKNKTITTAEYLMINDIKSAKKAFLTFAYFEQRNKKLAEKSAQQAQQAQQQHEIQIQQLQIQMKKMEIDGMLQGKKMDADATMQAHIINQQGGIAKTAMKVNADKENIYHQVNADLMAEQKTLNDTGQTTAPPPPSPMRMPQQQAPQQGSPASGTPEESNAAQLRQLATPQPTSFAQQ